MPTMIDPQGVHSKSDLANMAYTKCTTRIVNLTDLDLPPMATEHEYRDIFDHIVQSKSAQTQPLIDAINSVRFGIAPPVAFPTETVYGLGADAANRASIAGIFAAKGRPSDNPLIVHVASKEHLERLTGEPIPEVYVDLVKEHWPGPLTILIPVPENSKFANNVHPGQRTIGFRVPASKYARFFIAATDRPIAGPSANSSGKPSPTTAQHVMDDLKGKINFILDGGSCDVGVESTVVDGLHDPPLILRPGGVSQADLIRHGQRYSNVWRNTGIGYKQIHHNSSLTNGTDDGSENEAPRAPGMKYKHYAPHGRLTLFDGQKSAERLLSELDNLIDDKNSTNGTILDTSRSLTIALLTSTTWPLTANIPLDKDTTIPITNGHSDPLPTTHVPEVISNQKVTRSSYRNHLIHFLHLGRTPKQIAQSLFAALRTCDDLGCQYILAEAPSRPSMSVSSLNPTQKEEEDHHFDAVTERMRKAASEVIT